MNAVAGGRPSGHGEDRWRKMEIPLFSGDEAFGVGKQGGMILSDQRWLRGGKATSCGSSNGGKSSKLVSTVGSKYG